MNEKENDANLQETQQKEESEEFDTLIIDNVKYKTRLNKKFLDRKPYVPADPKLIVSHLPGTVSALFVKKGNKIKAGEKLLELEAMKMVNSIFADTDCIIDRVFVSVGELIVKGQTLIKLK
jgi:biotin carboxyl carrier protein